MWRMRNMPNSYSSLFVNRDSYWVLLWRRFCSGSDAAHFLWHVRWQQRKQHRLKGKVLQRLSLRGLPQNQSECSQKYHLVNHPETQAGNHCSGSADGIRGGAEKWCCRVLLPSVGCAWMTNSVLQEVATTSFKSRSAQTIDCGRIIAVTTTACAMSVCVCVVSKCST